MACYPRHTGEERHNLAQGTMRMKVGIALVIAVLAGCSETHAPARVEASGQNHAGEHPRAEGDREAAGEAGSPALDLVEGPRDAGSPSIEPTDAGTDIAEPLEPTEDAAVPPSSCTVDPDREPLTLIVPTDYATIQAAIDAAQPLDTVQVLPGTYSEHLRLRSGVRLIGSGAESTTLDGQGQATNLIDFTDASDVVVSGFTLRGVGRADRCSQPDDVLTCSGSRYAAAVYADGHAVWGDSERCNDASILFSDNVVIGNHIGVMTYYGAYAEVRDNVFDDNGTAFAAPFHGGAQSLLSHNIFVRNDEAIAVAASHVGIVHNVFVENGSVLRQENCQAGRLYCNVLWDNAALGGRLVEGEGENISADPLLVTAGPSIYELEPGSPALDRECAEEPAPDLDGNCE